MAIQNKKIGLWILLSLIIIFLDQWTKYIALSHLQYANPFVVLPVLNFTLSFNSGVAFGSFQNVSNYIFAGISLLASIIFLIWLAKTPTYLKMKSLGLSLILGGAVGNLIDRIRFSYVIDFLEFHIKTWHFAIFNLADSAVCVGAFFLILGFIFNKNK